MPPERGGRIRSRRRRVERKIEGRRVARGRAWLSVAGDVVPVRPDEPWRRSRRRARASLCPHVVLVASGA